MTIQEFIRKGSLQGEAEQFETGNCLFRQGEETESFFLITGGCIAFSDMAVEALEAASAPPSFLLGVTDLMNSTYSFTATAVERTEVIRISKTALLEALQRNPMLRLYLLKQMSTEASLTKSAFE